MYIKSSTDLFNGFYQIIQSSIIKNTEQQTVRYINSSYSIPGRTDEEITLELIRVPPPSNKSWTPLTGKATVFGPNAADTIASCWKNKALLRFNDGNLGPILQKLRPLDRMKLLVKKVRERK